MAEIKYDKQKELTLSGTEDKLFDLDYEYVIVTNKTNDIVYLSKYPEITAHLGEEDVVAVEPGDIDYIAAARGVSDHCYLLGKGNVDIELECSKLECKLKVMNYRSNQKNYNPNLLSNGDFMVNQRGKDSYTGTSAYTYTVDRWCIWKYNCDAYGTVTVNDDGSLSVDGVNGANDAILTQELENGAGLVGKIVTLSMEIEEIEGSILVQQHYNASSGLTVSAPGIHKVTFEWQEATKYRIAINNTNCSHYKIKWIKLETGTAVTPFTLSDPAAELAKCQRYYQIRSTGDIAEVDLRPTMRTTPTVTQLDGGNYAYSADF